jgi:AcrR family transcriptional regulator
MVRIVKEHAVRRDEILDEGQRLVYTKGYEQMTIQDILDDLQIAKGTFYHYFGSKQALLEAIIERMLDEVKQVLIPIVEAADMPALEKLQHFFTALGRWKTTQKAFLLALLRVWFTDDNVLVRQKVHATGGKRFTPLLTQIIQQGIEEGIFKSAHPEYVGQVILSISDGLNETLAELLLSSETDHGKLVGIESAIAAYSDAMERVLGAPSGSLVLADNATLREWVFSA